MCILNPHGEFRAFFVLYCEFCTFAAECNDSLLDRLFERVYPRRNCSSASVPFCLYGELCTSAAECTGSRWTLCLASRNGTSASVPFCLYGALCTSAAECTGSRWILPLASLFTSRPTSRCPPLPRRSTPATRCVDKSFSVFVNGLDHVDKLFSRLVYVIA
jgi:hypothetical protein